MGDTPKWMKRLVRARMKETGEKYTKTLRDIKKEQNILDIDMNEIRFLREPFPGEPGFGEVSLIEVSMRHGIIGPVKDDGGG